MSVSIESKYIYELKRENYSAFNELYDLYIRRLYGYCYQYTKSHEDTEEIVQDTFLKLWENRCSIKEENSIKNWLFATAKNQLINRYRARVNSPMFEEYVTYTNNGDEEAVSVNNAAHDMEYDDFCKLLEAAKRDLSETQLKVFTLSKQYYFTNQEIAEKLSMSEQTVKNQLSLGLKIIRERLQKHIALLPLFLFHLFERH